MSYAKKEARWKHINDSASLSAVAVTGQNKIKREVETRL
jgi:hypothetical protein